MYTFKTQGTCSSEIQFDVKDGIVTSVKFVRGCVGNTQGVARLAVGRSVDELINLLGGIQCRNGTSCPDQLSRALRQYKETQDE